MTALDTLRAAPAVDWYERRNELDPGMVFTTCYGGVVKLDYRVPGDGTKWRVLDWYRDHWSAEDGTIEPSDLIERLSKPTDFDRAIKNMEK